MLQINYHKNNLNVVLPAKKFDAGIKEYAWDRGNGHPLLATLWYPTHDFAEKILYLKHFPGFAKINAKPVSEKFPLIMLSHGSGGNRYNQYYLNEFLAQQGYIVCAVEHNHSQKSTTDNLQQLLCRPQDISFAIDELSCCHFLDEHIKSNQIIALGFSAGGFSAITLAGAIPNFIQDRAFKHYITTTITEITKKLFDSRVNALILLAPALAHLFPPEELKKIIVPVCLFTSGNDSVLLDTPKQYLLHLKTLCRHIEFLNADHYIYNVTPPKLFEKLFKLSCYDRGIKRHTIHPALCVEILQFLNSLAG